MREKDTMILEYNPKKDQEHIYFTWERKPEANPDWINLGEFYGTVKQAGNEITKRVKEYKKKKKIK